MDFLSIWLSHCHLLNSRSNPRSTQSCPRGFLRSCTAAWFLNPPLIIPFGWYLGDRRCKNEWRIQSECNVVCLRVPNIYVHKHHFYPFLSSSSLSLPVSLSRLLLSPWVQLTLKILSTELTELVKYFWTYPAASVLNMWNTHHQQEWKTHVAVSTSGHCHWRFPHPELAWVDCCSTYQSLVQNVQKALLQTQVSFLTTSTLECIASGKCSPFTAIYTFAASFFVPNGSKIVNSGMAATIQILPEQCLTQIFVDLQMHAK